jgi:photosystem II stability/assembly factor-like uncharacterized protein
MMRSIIGAVACVLVSSHGLAAQTIVPDSTFLAGMRWRPIGPANMGGRITDIEGLPSPSRTFYVASVAGGIWKTTNGGTTFRPLFQTERVASLGDLAIAPSDSMHIWAGTGEEDSRNSISPGGGIYKSTDGGMTWKLMGLEKTEHIGRVIVHPTNPDIVYVAALGAAWRSNPERGLYKTEDGGKTWKLIKFISDQAGFVDIAMDPTNPNVLFAASYERVRGPYFMTSGGPGSALWKTADGGATWSEVQGGGFPATKKGRIGIAIAPSNAQVVYALVEAEPASDTPRASIPGLGRYNCTNPGKGGCGLYRSNDGGATWEWMAGNHVRPFYYSQVRVDIKNPDRVYWSSTPVNVSSDGGRTVGTTTVGLHVDHHALWLDPANADHFIVGNDGGIAETWDKGGSYDFINTIPVGQFYAISYDLRVPYWVCGGLQDNGSWCGPSRKANANNPITNADWFKFGGGDGFVTAQDPREWNIVYGESQGGNMSRIDLKTGVRTRLREPSWTDRYRAFEDSIIVERGDTVIPLTPAQETRLVELRGRQVADSTAYYLRWNWNTPFFLSAHDPHVFYAGANRVLKSTKQGEELQPISDDLTTRDQEKIFHSIRRSGGITKDTTGAELYSTVVSLAESPIKAGVLYAGTDDGKVWTSPDDGKTWLDLTARFARLVPANTYVSRIEPSRAATNRWYITFDNHRNGDFTPYVFVTDDDGKSFRSIAANLPRGGPDFVHVVREDPVNSDLLYVGTDIGVFASLDRGRSWTKFMLGLPTTPVHDLKVHPRDRELIAGTHGRSIWIVDVAPLQQYNAALVAAAAPALLQPKPALAYRDALQGGEGFGHKFFQARSPSFGAEITYWVPASAAPPPPAAITTEGNGGTNGHSRPPGRARAELVVLDSKGDTVRTLNGAAARGLQRVYWNLQKRAAPRVLSAAERRDSAALEPRIAFVADSLVGAGFTREAVDLAITNWRESQRAGSFSFFGGAGTAGSGGRQQFTGGPLSGALDAFVPRPGETKPRGARPATPDEVEARELFTLLRLTDRPNLRGGAGFATSPEFVEPGTYTIVLKLGDQISRQSLEVVRAE